MTLEEAKKLWKTPNYNKELIRKYPFLLPRNRFTREVPDDYDWTYSELDGMPTGWRFAFGEELCEKIQKALFNHNCTNYYINDIKEKYGSLHWYGSNEPECVSKILNEYVEKSIRTCICCGKPATRMTTGWISPFCDDCAEGKQTISLEEFLKTFW